MNPALRPSVTIVSLATVLCIGLRAQPPAVDPDLPPYRPEAMVHGSLAIDGGPLSAAWAKGFGRFQPAVEVRLAKQTESSTDALGKLIDGSLQLVWFVPEIQPFQMDLARKALGHGPLIVAVASGGAATHANRCAMAIYVNAGNPVSRLTLTQLDAIFSRDRRRGFPHDISTWGQLGLTGEWADKPIHLYGMSINNQYGYPHGFAYFMMVRMMDNGEFKPGLVQVPDTSTGPGKNYAFVEVVRDVATDRYGMGYAGFEFRTAGVKTLAIAEDASSPFYAGTQEEVAHRYYPLTMSKCLAANREPGRPLEPVAREFLRYVLSREGQEAVAHDPGGSLPLPAAFAEEERAKLD
jgi:phosphate transport system substrate-binding protein